jgi:hypothetical protein
MQRKLGGGEAPVPDEGVWHSWVMTLGPVVGHSAGKLGGGARLAGECSTGAPR